SPRPDGYGLAMKDPPVPENEVVDAKGAKGVSVPSSATATALATPLPKQYRKRPFTFAPHRALKTATERLWRRGALSSPASFVVRVRTSWVSASVIQKTRPSRRAPRTNGGTVGRSSADPTSENVPSLSILKDARTLAPLPRFRRASARTNGPRICVTPSISSTEV